MTMALVPFFAEPQSAACGRLAQQVLDTFPGGSYALSALLRLMDIRETTEVPTAAVECRIQPRLLINPDFVDRHAATPEKLLMLVMHELHHVLLGHTTLFSRCTPVQNFVFDAVINGVICRMFPDPQYTAFLTDYYDSASFPQCVLRPPPGWPKRKTMAPGIAQLPMPRAARVQEIHQALYSAAGASYQEVYEALPKLLGQQDISDIALLGGHPAEGVPDGQLEQQAPVLFDIVRALVEQWPQPPDPIRGRSLADVLKTSSIQATPLPGHRRLLRQLIRKVAGLRAAGAVRQMRQDTLEVPSPLPSMGRRSMVLRALGCEPLLHLGPTPWHHSVRSGERVHVYLDVSGSMDAIKGPLYGAVLDCQALVFPMVHLFSTRVVDVSLAELRQGICKTTGGTDIGCVAAHMSANRVRRALLITDGWVGEPRGQHRQTLAEAKLAVAYLGTSINQDDLKQIANHTTLLSIGV